MYIGEGGTLCTRYFEKRLLYPYKAGFGIAGSARVGGSARRPSPRGRPWVLGSDFFKKFPEKWLFWGMFV